MKFLKNILVVSVAIAFCISSLANEKHDEKEHQSSTEVSQSKEDGHQDHKEEASNSHGEHEEENSQIGQGKGIVSASETEGIQISVEAEKNFEIKRVKFLESTIFEIQKSAIVTAGTEVNLYRFRNGYYKRVDFDLIKKSEKTIFIKSKDLKNGDEIVIHGTGLLRIAEIAAFGGAPEGHSH